MAAKAVVVSGVPIYEVTLCGDTQLCNNNPDGYYLYNDKPSGSTYVRILATGYKPAVYPVSLDNLNQTIRFGGEAQAPNDILFPALTFSKPSRDRIINVKANFCNLFDADDIPIFDAFIDYLIVNNLTKANDWVSRLKDTDTVHVNLNLSGDYNENLGWAPRYPIPGTDWTGNIDGFKRVIDFLLSKNFIPHIHLAADGQGYDPNGMTYGINWALINLPEILYKLKDYTEQVLWNGGWDGCFPDWSLYQTAQLYQLLRDVLGSEAQLAAELGGPGSVGYCHFGNGASDWYLKGIKEIDSYLIEVMTFPPNSDGVQQTAARMLGPQATNIEPQNKGPYYLEAPRERSLAVNMFETCAYQITRKQIESSDAVRVANFCKNFGFVNFGNGQPSL